MYTLKVLNNHFMNNLEFLTTTGELTLNEEVNQKFG